MLRIMGSFILYSRINIIIAVYVYIIKFFTVYLFIGTLYSDQVESLSR